MTTSTAFNTLPTAICKAPLALCSDQTLTFKKPLSNEGLAAICIFANNAQAQINVESWSYFQLIFGSSEEANRAFNALSQNWNKDWTRDHLEASPAGSDEVWEAFDSTDSV